MSRHRLDGREEDGQILIAVLIFIVVISVVVGVVLSFAETDFRLTQATRAQRQEIYAADAAIDAAINYYHRRGSSASERCPGTATTPWTPPNPNNVTSVSVTCSADGSNAAVPANLPTAPLITRCGRDLLGAFVACTDPADGINAGSSATLPARGGVGVYAEGNISLGPSNMYVPGGSIVAKGTCSPSPVSSPSVWSTPVTCSNTTPSSATTALVDDPANITSAPAVPSAALTLRSVPACPADGGPITFQPGLYTDLNGLKALTTGCGSSVFYFPPNTSTTPSSPGFYHFNFAGCIGSSCTWALSNDEFIIGGTIATGATLATIASDTAGTRCDDTKQGVQFIFSGESALSFGSGGGMETCPPLFSDNTTQRVSIWGPKTALAATTTITPAPSNFTSTGAVTFSPLSFPTSASVPAPTPVRTATLGVDFAVPTIAAGSVITATSLAFTHTESVTAPATLTALARLGSGGGAPTANLTSALSCVPSVTCLTKSTSSHVDTVELPATFKNTARYANPTNTLHVDFSATGTSGAFIETLTSIVLTITYTPTVASPTFAPQSGCTITGSTCPVVSTQGLGSLSIKGTVYAPQAFLQIALINAATQTFGRGVIARRLDTQITPSNDCLQGGAFNADPADESFDHCYPFQLPRNKAAGNTAVFVATVNGRVRARALVDFSGTTPVVRNWSNTNEAA